MGDMQFDRCKFNRYNLLFCKGFQLRAATNELLRSLPIISRLLEAEKERCEEYEPDEQQSPDEEERRI